MAEGLASTPFDLFIYFCFVFAEDPEQTVACFDCCCAQSFLSDDSLS